MGKDIDNRKYYVILVVVICGFLYFFLSNKYYVFTNQAGLRKTEASFSKVFMPSGACDFLEKNNIEGPIFNTIDFGPYIGYRFYPKKRIIIDTRTDLYKSDFYKSYNDAQRYPRRWIEFEKRYGFGIVFLRHLFSDTDRILRYLREQKDWKLVYYDKNSVLFLKDIPMYRKYIEEFEINFEKKELFDSDIDLNAAVFFEKIGKKDLAEKVYLRLLEKNPESLEAGNNLIAVYISGRRFNEAFELIQRFLKYYPRSAELYANLGILYLCAGDIDKAFLTLDKAVRLNPYMRNVAYILGKVYFQKGDLDRAESQFLKYIRLDPYDAGAHRLLGEIYKQKGFLEKAEVEYNEAEELEGIDAE